MSVNALRDKVDNLLTRQDQINQAAHNDGVDALTGEEAAEFDRIEAEIVALEAQIEREAKFESRRTKMSEPTTEPVKPEAITSADPAERDAVYASAFDTYLRFGAERLAPEQRGVLAMGRVDERGPAFQAAFGDNPQTVTTTGGGYLIPRGFQAEISNALLAYGGVREVARILPTPTGNPLDWPTEDDTASVGELLAINTAAADGAETFGQKTLLAYKYSSKSIAVPIELAQDSAFDLQAHITDIAGTRIGRITNTHFTTGDNSSKPQGVVIGAYSSVTSEAATGVTYNDLVNLEHSVNRAYRQRTCSFMFADSTLKSLKKIKDADGNPIWRSGLTGGSPADILGYRYVVNDDMDAATTGLKSVLFGDFSKYVIRDVMDFTLLRLVERRAEYGQVVYLAFSRHDGRSIAAETNNGALRYLLQA